MELQVEVPTAPDVTRETVTCPKCKNTTHFILARCPACNKVTRYFHSDLDFVTEITKLSDAYVGIIAGIKASINEYIAEFNVTLPKRWSAKITCDCGETYTIEIPLPQLP